MLIHVMLDVYDLKMGMACYFYIPKCKFKTEITTVTVEM